LQAMPSSVSGKRSAIRRRAWLVLLVMIVAAP
jgi:hypothetical protein